MNIQISVRSSFRPYALTDIRSIWQEKNQIQRVNRVTISLKVHVNFSESSGAASMPPWLSIVKDRRFATGATIPYVIGALRVCSGAPEVDGADVARGDLRSLLVSMRDDIPPTGCIAIQHCSHVNGYVAAWHCDRPQHRLHLPSPFRKDRGLFSCEEIDGARIQDFESLFDALWNSHAECLVKGQFSREWVEDLNGRRKREWVSFDDCKADERAEIRLTLADPANRTRA
jgi:hypothetical protein